jgi:hemerythrin-like domain-containing protein
MTVTDTSATTQPRHLDESGRAVEAEVADHIREHHRAMVAELARLTTTLRDAPPAEAAAARAALAQWFDSALVPHADEEEATTYRAARELPEGRLLIEAMVREHVLIKRLVALFGEAEGSSAAAYARTVLEAFTSHQEKENEVILPLLVAAPQVSLAAVVGAAHGGHQVGEHAHHH